MTYFLTLLDDETLDELMARAPPEEFSLRTTKSGSAKPKRPLASPAAAAAPAADITALRAQ